MTVSMNTALTGKITRVVLLALIVINLAFIWANSLPDQATSKTTSMEVVEVVKPVLEPVVGSGNVTDHLVRKLAHYIEYSSLGILLALFMVYRRRVSVQSVVNSLFFGLLAALSDETIQIFTKRGSQVQDVWLDLLGIASGILAVLAIYALTRLLLRNRAGRQL